MKKSRRHETDPCKDCIVRPKCKKKANDGSLCRDKYEFRLFNELIENNGKILFYENNKAIFKVGYWVVLNDIADLGISEKEKEFDREFKKYLLDKFMINPDPSIEEGTP